MSKKHVGYPFLDRVRLSHMLLALFIHKAFCLKHKMQKSPAPSSLAQVKLICYADHVYWRAQKKLLHSAKHIGCIPTVLGFNPHHIPPWFAQKYQHILQQPKGAGYWLWKPFFINQELHKLKDDEILFYADSGSCFLAPAHPLIETFEQSDQLIMCFDAPDTTDLDKRPLERNCTKRDLLIELDCDTPEYLNSIIRTASFSLWKKTDVSLRFARDWLHYACNEQLLTDRPSKAPNYPGFIRHLHDQAIFSLLSKKYGFASWRLPCQYGQQYMEKHPGSYPDSRYGQIIQHTRQKSRGLAIKITWRVQQAWRSFMQTMKGGGR